MKTITKFAFYLLVIWGDSLALPLKAQNNQVVEKDGFAYEILSDSEVGVVGLPQDKNKIKVPAEVKLKKHRYKVTRVSPDFQPDDIATSLYKNTKGQSNKSLSLEILLRTPSKQTQNKVVVKIHIPASVDSISDCLFSSAGFGRQAQCPVMIDPESPHFLCSDTSLIRAKDQHLMWLRLPEPTDGEIGYSLTLPEGISSFNPYLFQQICMKEIRFPQSLTRISDEAFLGAAFFADLQLPPSLRHIGAKAFNYCAGLGKLTLPEGLEHIGNEAFAESHLRQINLPGSLRELGAGAFLKCNDLDTVYMHCTLDSLPKALFAGTAHLQKVVWPKGLRRISQTAFFQSGLKQADLPETLTEIGPGAFRSSQLTVCSLPKGIKTIGAAAFADCQQLAVLVLPESLDSVAPNAFGKSALSTLVLEGNVRISPASLTMAPKLHRLFLAGHTPDPQTAALIKQFAKDAFHEIVFPTGHVDAYRKLLGDGWENESAASLQEGSFNEITYTPNPPKNDQTMHTRIYGSIAQAITTHIISQVHALNTKGDNISWKEFTLVFDENGRCSYKLSDSMNERALYYFNKAFKGLPPSFLYDAHIYDPSGNRFAGWEGKISLTVTKITTYGPMRNMSTRPSHPVGRNTRFPGR